MAKLGNYFESGMSHVSSFLLCLTSFRKGKKLIYLGLYDSTYYHCLAPDYVHGLRGHFKQLTEMAGKLEKFSIKIKIKKKNGLGQKEKFVCNTS